MMEREEEIEKTVLEKKKARGRGRGGDHEETHGKGQKEHKLP